jgi:outer membrane protein assembly factor BamB
LSAPSVDKDGTIRVGNGKTPMCNVDPADGSEIWCATNSRGGDAGQSSPAVSITGRAFMGARDNDLWAVDADGTVAWHYHVQHDGDVTTPPTIGSDGTVYMASNALGGGWLFAMNPDDGTVKWRVVNQIGILDASPALDSQGNIYVGLIDSRVRKFAPDGTMLWNQRVAKRVDARRQPNDSPSIGADGTVYAGADDGVWALDGATGKVKWSFDTDGLVEAAPSIGKDGTIYASSSKPPVIGGGVFYALTPQGTLKWSYESDDNFLNAQAAIGADGTIYVPSGNKLLALSNTGQLLWSFSTAFGRFQSGPIIGAPGVVYIASTDNNLYAIGN